MILIPVGLLDMIKEWLAFFSPNKYIKLKKEISKQREQQPAHKLGSCSSLYYGMLRYRFDLAVLHWKFTPGLGKTVRPVMVREHNENGWKPKKSHSSIVSCFR